MDVPEIGGELGELALHVAPLAVPADERPRGESVPHIVEPRSAAVAMSACWRTQADSTGDDGEVVPGAALRDAGAALREEERRGGRTRKQQTLPLCVATQGPACRVVYGYEAGLAELRAPHGEDAGPQVHVVALEGECLTEAQTGSGEQPEERAVGVCP